MNSIRGQVGQCFTSSLADWSQYVRITMPKTSGVRKSNIVSITLGFPQESEELISGFNALTLV